MNQNSSTNFIKNMAIFTFALLLGIASTICYNKYSKPKYTVKEENIIQTTNTNTEEKTTTKTTVYDFDKECLNQDICTKTYNVNINNQEYKISYKKDINEFKDELNINNTTIDGDRFNKIAFLDNEMIAIISSYPGFSTIDYYDKRLKTIKSYSSVTNLFDIESKTNTYTNCVNNSDKQIIIDDMSYPDQTLEIKKYTILDNNTFKEEDIYSYNTFCSAQS